MVASLTQNPLSTVGPLRRILIAEDDTRTRDNLRAVLSEDGLQVETASDGRQALQALADNHHSIFLTDLKMPGLDGLELMRELKERDSKVTVIVMTAFGSIEQAVQAMHLGAADFLTKPIDPDHLRLVVGRALRERSLLDEVQHLREQLNERFAFRNVLSKSPRMHAVFEMIGSVASTTTTVLIEGETGTGKEMVARAIHEASAAHRSGPFIAVNCAALPETLLDSELFGHEKGAFTGAINYRPGRFELAQGGTIFLDELGEMSHAVQVKLLRVLQEHSFERVGGSKSIDLDVRVVAATNKPLAKMVKRKKFRDDLYYRVNVVRIELPPLRERPEDIPLLAAHFARKYARTGEAVKSFSPDALNILLNYTWPGNVRELENMVERACVISSGRIVEASHLPPELSDPTLNRNPFALDMSKPLSETLREATAWIEQRYVRKALEKAHGNVSRCAELCGISRRSLTSKIAEYGIDRTQIKNRVK